MTWSVFRRYRQFRDLHSVLGARYCSRPVLNCTVALLRYGSAVSSLTFPSRKLFGSRSEAVSSERQRELGHYLTSLLAACSRYRVIINHSLAARCLESICEPLSNNFQLC